MDAWQAPTTWMASRERNALSPLSLMELITTAAKPSSSARAAAASTATSQIVRS